MSRLRPFGAACGVVAAVLVAEAQIFRPQEANSLEKKIAVIVQQGTPQGTETNGRSRPVRTTITEGEVNSYFKFQGSKVLPVGVVEPVVTIHESGRVTGRVIVDLDAVRTAKERPWTDPLSWVGGQVLVRITGMLRAANGKGTFTLESAMLGEVAIPKMVLQELISYYTRTPESPNGFDLDQPFDLPQRIQRVEFRRGAIVIQQ